MLATFQVTLNQMMILFAFMVCGYFFQKKKLMPDSLSSVLSKLEVMVFLPALSFNTFAKNIRIDILKDKIWIILASVIVLGVTYLIAVFLANRFTKVDMTKQIYIYGFTIPNLGYLGYPVVNAVFGEQALFDMMIFALAYNLFIFTVGMYILNPKREWTLKTLLNPTMVSILLGVFVGLFNITLPKVISDAATTASACMAPIAMILTGFVLARSPLKKMLMSAKMYLVAFLRLIAIPVLVGGTMYLLGIRNEILLVTVATLSMPMGLNNVVFPEAFGGDSTTGAQSCFVSTVLGIITIPIAFAILSSVVQ